MILYLYAVVDELGDITGLTGVAGESLARLSLHDHVVVGGWMEGAPTIARDHLTAQDRLVRQLHDRATSLLPMRFGTSFPSTGDAERAIKTMSAGLQERVERARGREQMTIRVLGGISAAGPTGATGATGTGAAGLPALASPVPEATAGVPTKAFVLPEATVGAGARYLAARAAKATPPELAPLLHALKPFERATRVEPGRRKGVVATIYQLIDRGAAEGYREAAERAAADLPALTARVTGPSPCYAFT